MFEPFLLVGGLLFWIFAGILATILITCVEMEKGSMATLAMVAFGLIFIVWGDVSIFGWIAANTVDFLLYLVGYFVVGTGWTLMKWYFYLIGRKEEATLFKIKFLKDEGIAGNKIPDDKQVLFQDKLLTRISSSTYSDQTYPPNAMLHKPSIIRWAAYWPFSAIWTILGDGIKRVWDFVYVQIGGLLQRMSSKIFSDI